MMHTSLTHFLVSVLLTLIVVGVLLYVVNQFIPMDPKIKQLINLVVVICAVLYVVRAFLGPNYVF
jgi:hypothetical protein